MLYLFYFRLDRHQHQRCKLNETATARAKVKCTKQKQHQIGVAQRIQANKQAGRWKCMYIYFSNGIKFKSTHLSAIETSLQAKSATHIHTHTMTNWLLWEATENGEKKNEHISESVKLKAYILKVCECCRAATSYRYIYLYMRLSELIHLNRL